MAAGVEAFSWDCGVNRLLMDACGAAGGGVVAAGVNGDGLADGTAANGEAGAAAEKGEAFCCGMLKGDPLGGGLGEKNGAACCGAASDIMEKGLGSGASCLTAKGLDAGASAAGLMENGEGAAAAGSWAAKPGEAAAKGLIGNACACDAPASAWGAIWKGETAGAGDAGWPNEKGDGEEGDGGDAGSAAPIPSRACAINPGSLAAGNGTSRGSWGEMGTWKSAGQTRYNSKIGSAACPLRRAFSTRAGGRDKGCSAGRAPARTTSGGSWLITSPTVSGAFVGVAPAMLKGDMPIVELIGGAAIGSLPAVLKSGLPPI